MGKGQIVQTTATKYYNRDTSAIPFLQLQCLFMFLLKTKNYSNGQAAEAVKLHTAQRQKGELTGTSTS